MDQDQLQQQSLSSTPDINEKFILISLIEKNHR